MQEFTQKDYSISQSPLVFSTSKVSLSTKSFESWRKYIYDSTGIYFQDNKKYLLESRLQKRISYLGIESFEKYLDFIKFNPAGTSEVRYLYEAITINETFFFRNQPQLDALVTTVLPGIISAKQNMGKNKIKIWSAASSSGEEAYSIAMVINDLIFPKYPNIEFEIVGTDISNAVIDVARRASYKEYSVRNTPVYYLKKYFKSNGHSFNLDTKIKDMAYFKLLNLYDDLSMRTMISFDVIFCANVLIYFDPCSKVKVVNHLYNSLTKDGFLFIGYSETLHGISKSFKLTSFPKTIGYKKE